ncbi:MAG TPA: tetratricopeptide repeat protein, partial [Allosphingosinicella sp.]
MTPRRLFIAAAAMALPLPAVAGVTVLGTSAARACFEAAERELPPRTADFRNCDAALQPGAATRQDVVATHVNRGILHMRRNDLEAALADFDAATALEPNEPEAYLNRGAALLKRAETARALAMFDQALAKNTSRPELAYYARAVAHEGLGNLR